LPSIGSYVGADLTAGILACGLHEPFLKKDKTVPAGHRPAKPVIRVLLDIGTNGELILAGPDGLLACATAAGPAFEGANIDCGMPALAGAIDQATLSADSRDLELSVIGGTARGICGSGLVALAAALLDAGALDETGRLLTDDELPITFPRASGAGAQNPWPELLDLTGQQHCSPAREPAGCVPVAERHPQLQNAKAAIAAGFLSCCRKLRSQPTTSPRSIWRWLRQLPECCAGHADWSAAAQPGRPGPFRRQQFRSGRQSVPAE
jgi:hypothetical protein